MVVEEHLTALLQVLLTGRLFLYFFMRADHLVSSSRISCIFGVVFSC